jgi:hypothetical protein
MDANPECMMEGTGRMQNQSVTEQRPRVILDWFKPKSIFICPCHVDSAKIRELAGRALEQQPKKASSAIETEELLHLQLKPRPEETCLGLHVNIQPHLFFLPELNWVALTIEAELSPAAGNSISFEQLLAFNSNFRICQGKLDRHDEPRIGGEKKTFCLAGGIDAAAYYAQVAKEELGSFSLHRALKKTVTLSIAQFERPLTDTELYSFGTIAHSDETADPDWAKTAITERVHDRWCKVGIRLFAHSYSLVASCGVKEGEITENLSWFRPIFEKGYVRIGARMALERAVLMDLRSALHEVENLDELRQQRKNWVNSRRVLGVRWTPEKTQHMQVEQLWRNVSGMEKMSEEIDKRFEQTISLFEAEATGRLNKLLTWFQVMVAGLASGGVTANLTRDLGRAKSLPWVFGIAILTMLVWGFWLSKRMDEIRKRRWPAIGKRQR